MTPTAKRFITLDNQYQLNDGEKKANTSMKKQQELVLSEKDMSDIEEYYQCADIL